MANLGYISQIDPDGSGDTYTLRDPNAGSPLIATVRVFTGDQQVTDWITDDWVSVNTLDLYCSEEGIDASVSINTESQYKSVTILLAEPATQNLTFKVLGRTL